MKYKPYPAYKPSGVEWIGEIPEEWDVNKLKYFIIKNDGGVWGKEEGNAYILRSTEITIDGKWNFENEPAKRRLSKQEYEKALLHEGDLLITKSSGSVLHIGKTAIVTQEVASVGYCFSNFMQRVRPQNGCSSNYFYYFLNSTLANKQYNYLSNSTSGLSNLGEELISRVLISIPPPIEQKSIANFLDQETARIDTLIEKQNRLIELLKEKRSALITHAVTKGLDPNAKMKPSGVEWIGEIPEGWEVRKLKFCAKCNENALNDKTNPNYEIEYLDIGSVNSEGQILNTEKLIFREAPSRARRIPHNNDIILSTVRTYLKAIAYLEDIPSNMIVSTGFAVIEGDNGSIFPKFLYYFSRGEYFVQKVMKESKGVSYPAINPTFLVTIRILLPSHHEQEEIVNFIDMESDKIDILMSKIEKRIELLTEYKQSLITHAVTGKIDVRDYAESQNN